VEGVAPAPHCVDCAPFEWVGVWLQPSSLPPWGCPPGLTILPPPPLRAICICLWNDVVQAALSGFGVPECVLLADMMFVNKEYERSVHLLESKGLLNRGDIACVRPLLLAAQCYVRAYVQGGTFVRRRRLFPPAPPPPPERPSPT
jgi:hypothetical protein